MFSHSLSLSNKTKASEGSSDLVQGSRLSFIWCPTLTISLISTVTVPPAVVLCGQKMAGASLWAQTHQQRQVGLTYCFSFFSFNQGETHCQNSKGEVAGPFPVTGKTRKESDIFSHHGTNEALPVCVRGERWLPRTKATVVCLSQMPSFHGIVEAQADHMLNHFIWYLNESKNIETYALIHLELQDWNYKPAAKDHFWSIKVVFKNKINSKWILRWTEILFQQRFQRYSVLSSAYSQAY